MDYNFVHKSVQDFWRQFVNVSVLLGNGYELGNIRDFHIGLADLGGQSFDFLLQLFLLAFVTVGQLVKAFVTQFPVDIILIDFTEQAIKLLYPLFVLFYLLLLGEKFKSPFGKRCINLSFDKHPLKLLQIGQEVLQLLQHQLIQYVLSDMMLRTFLCSARPYFSAVLMPVCSEFPPRPR